ncbi:MAG: hypothetical protein ACLPN1_11835 [Dissulfurispiraceae bacterium]
MKYTKFFFALYALCVGAALTTSTAFAQVPTAYKPGDTLSFTIKFDGEGLEKLTNASVNLTLTSPVKEDQKAFLTYINVSAGSGARPGVFEVSAKIPDYTASGTYTLHVVNTGTPYVGFSYSEGLPSITITVINNDRFEKPKLRSVEITSKP